MTLFKGTIPEAKYLKEPISAISKLVSEAKVEITEDGLKISALDPAKIAMVDFEVKSGMFVDFDVAESVSFGVDVDYLAKVLRRAKSREEVTIELTEDKSRLILTFKDGYRRRFSIPLMQTLEEEHPDLSQFEFKARVEVEGGFLQDAIKDAKLVADEVTFIAKEDSFEVLAKSESGEVRAELVKGQDPALLDIEVEEESESKYGIDYLEKIVRAEKVADVIKIEFSTNYLCKITYQTVDKIELRFVLANRVEE